MTDKIDDDFYVYTLTIEGEDLPFYVGKGRDWNPNNDPVFQEWINEK